MTAKPMRVLLPVLTFGLLLLLLTNTGEAAAQELKDVFIGARQDRIAAIEVRGEEVRVYRSTRRETVDGTQIVVTLATGEGGIPISAGERLVTSDDGGQTGRVSYALSKEGQILVTFERLRDGQPSWKIASNGPTNFYISNDGSTVAAVIQDMHNPAAGRLTLYDAEGQELGSVKQPLILRTRLADDGSRVVVNTGEDALQIFDRHAKRLHRLPASADFRISADGRTIATFHSNAVVLYRMGKEISRIPTHGVARDAAFTRDGLNVAVVEKHTLYLYDVAQKALVLSRNTTQRDWEYRTVALAPDGATVAVGMLTITERKTRRRQGKAEAAVLVLDSKGAVHTRHLFTPQMWNRLTPSLRFFAGGAKLLVVTPDAVRLLDLPGRK